MQRSMTPERRSGSRALPDISALAASPSKTERGAVNSAPIDALLQLVSLGHCLQAELLDLTGALPQTLKLQAVSEGRFSAVLFDYRYFKDRLVVEQRVENNPDLSRLDEEFRELHGRLLERFYNLFERIVGLHASLLEFLGHLEQGLFIQSSLDTLLLNTQGKQLLCEALSLFGALLLALDRRLQGPVRERLVVAHYRLKGGSQAVGPSANAVVALCASTGLLPARRISPAGYPEVYFARLPLPEGVVLRLIDAIRADDIYNRAAIFPAPEHRVCALAWQAALLYLLLCFAPQTLHRDGSLMRTLADRHFADNWVVAWGPGFCTDLAMEWDSFKAARAALAGVVSVTRAKDVAAATAAFLPDCRGQLSAHLSRGSLSEEYVLEHMSDILTTLRNGNATLRWLLLHGVGTQRKLRSAVAAAAPPNDELLGLLLDIAQLEAEVKQVYGKLLESKQERWRAQQASLQSSISGLAKFFSALSQSLPDTEDPPDFSVWFEHLHREVDTMLLDDPGGSSRRVQGVVAALNELERFHSGEASLQTAHYLSGIRGHLAHLLRLADVRPAMLQTLADVSDFAYGWGLLDNYVARIQAQIRKQPETVGKLSSLFQKAQSLLQHPQLRLGQAKSGQLWHVSQFYSSSLLAFAHRVCQVIPGSLWELVDSMATICTHRLQPLGSKIEVTALRDAAQLEQRAALVEKAARFATFASGIRRIDRCKVGVSELAAMRLVEDGLRQLLAMRIAGAGASLLTFPQSAVPLVHPSPFAAQRGGLSTVFGAGSGFSGELAGRQDLVSRLVELQKRMEGIRSILENLQDFVGLPGLRVWHQQMAAVAAAGLAKDEAQMKASAGSLQKDPKPLPPLTLLGRVAGEMLRLSSPQRTQYFAQTAIWEDGGGSQVLGPQQLRLAREALGGASLAALDRLLGFRVQFCLEDTFKNLGKLDAGTLEGLQILEAGTAHEALLLKDPASDKGPAAFSDAVKKCSGVLQPLLEALQGIGQAQLLRRQLVLEVGDAFLMDGWSQLGEPLKVLTENVISNLKLQPSAPGLSQAAKTPLQLDPFIKLSEACGLEDVLRRVYVTPVGSPDLPRLVFLSVLSACSQLRFDRTLGMLVRRHRNAPDAAVLAVGVTTLLNQLPQHHVQALLALAGRWVQTYVQAVTGSVAQGVEAAGIQVKLPADVGTVLAFFAEMARHGLISEDEISRSIPFVYDTWLSVLD